MILSSSVLSLPRPLCRDALWRERGAVSDRARCVVRDGLPTCHSNAKTRCFGYNCAPSGIFKPEERLRASGARDAGFGDGRVGRVSRLSEKKDHNLSHLLARHLRLRERPVAEHLAEGLDRIGRVDLDDALQQQIGNDEEFLLILGTTLSYSFSICNCRGCSFCLANVTT